MNLIPVPRTVDVETFVGVTDRSAQRRAVRIARRHVAAALAACSRSFASEIVRTRRVGDAPAHVSPLLADIVVAAVDAAAISGGAYDPTARQLTADPRRALVGCAGSVAAPRPAPGWARVRLDGSVLRVPRNTTLSLESVALGMAAQRAAAEIAAVCGTGALVVAGTSASSAGPTHEWDIPGGHLGSGLSRCWRGPTGTVRPSDGRTELPVWRQVVVTTTKGAEAAALAQAAGVWGVEAPEMLARLGVSARLTSLDGAPTYVA